MACIVARRDIEPVTVAVWESSRGTFLSVISSGMEPITFQVACPKVTILHMVAQNDKNVA
jgi:hypothetical protein